MTITADDFTTDTDRWGYRKGARFVGPDEWLTGVRRAGLDLETLVLESVTEAYAAAADDNGLIIDFRPNEWYERHVSDAMRSDDDGPDWTLTYDRFVAMALMDIDMTLSNSGYLAGRGNGDSKDRRLTLPAADRG
ncbi:hypothetical protein AB0I89_24170 [Micromonospora sp. NPDC049801]|uniref:hypothetical protein n=1 Tax=unclassified Micromonospora TaxID=2617518 RepID=UPI0033FC3D52